MKWEERQKPELKGVWLKGGVEKERVEGEDGKNCATKTGWNRWKKRKEEAKVDHLSNIIEQRRNMNKS